ncbi:MAG: response regulator [Planctomycetaceae bacterium]
MIRLLIVDDSVTQREIFRRLFAEDGEFTVVAEAATGEDAIQLVKKHLPDVVLMDIHMPGMGGIEATREIMRVCPVPIVVASATLRKQDIDLAMRALEAGAVSVIEKSQGAVLLHLKKIAPQLRIELILPLRKRLCFAVPCRRHVWCRCRKQIRGSWCLWGM